MHTNRESSPTATEIFQAPERLHAGNVKETLRALIAAPGTRVVIDLSKTVAIDSTALGEIVRMHRKLGASGGHVEFAAPSVGIKRVLTLTRLDTIIAIHANLKLALSDAGAA